MMLLDANMVAFQTSRYMLLTVGILILAGNTWSVMLGRELTSKCLPSLQLPGLLTADPVDYLELIAFPS